MATVGNLVINIAANTVSLEQGVTKSKGLVGDLNKTIGSLGLGTIGAGAAFYGLSRFMGDSVEMAREAEAIQADLAAVLASTKGAAGVTAEEINNMASALSKVTTFEDDTIVKSQAMLLTFTNIGSDVFPQTTEAMLNMAQKFGGLESASLQLGKALNDPVAGVGALRRVGVQLTEAQEEQIKKFMAVGDIASAQKIILAELETEFGGLARAIGETSEGKLTIFQNNLANTQEAIGMGLLPVIDQITGSFANLLSPLIDSNDELTILTQTLATFEATPLLATLDNAAFFMKQVNEVGGFLNGLLGDIQGKLGITSEKTGDMGESFRAVMLPITLLTQGPMAALRDIMLVITDLMDQVKTFSPGQVLTDLKNIGGSIGLNFAGGGVVPGPIGAPQVAVVHGGEMITPPGQGMMATVQREQRVYIQTLNLQGVQNASAFLAELEALS